MKLGSSDIGSVYIGSTAVNKIYIGSTEVWTSNSGLLADYPGAAAAYSLRLLQTTYTGDAIRVRRASDNAESDIGFVSGQLDTSTLETFCSGTDGFVTTWYDQSGNGYDATQSTSANQPKIVSSGSTILENGKPSIQMDNTNDFLRSNCQFGTDTTIFGIFRNLDTIGVIYSGTNTGSDFIYAYRNDTGGIASGVSVSSTYKNSQLQSLTNQLSVLNAINTGSQILWSSFLSSVDTARYANLQIGSSVLGATSMNWSEIILYPSDQNANRTGIETNINSHYSIY